MLLYGKSKNINLLDILSEKLEKLLIDETLSAEVKEVLNILESFKSCVSNLKRPNESNFGSKFSQDEPKNIQLKDQTQYATCEKNTDKANWRKLKPDPNSLIFKYQK